jgi:hypothetical protein
MQIVKYAALALIANVCIAGGDASEWPPPVETSHLFNTMGARLSPLVLKEVRGGYITFKWDNGWPEHARRLDGRRPRTDAPEGVLLRLTHIEVRGSYAFSEDENARFARLFREGIVSILEGQSVAVESVTPPIGEPFAGVIYGVVLMNEHYTQTVQEKMVELGHAEVSERASCPRSNRYGDSYRDKLLRLEGVARHLERGIWKTKRNGQQAESTVPVKAAPGASSTAR